MHATGRSPPSPNPTPSPILQGPTRSGGRKPGARASPAHAADARLQPDAVGGLDVLLRHLLGPHRLRPAPGGLLQLQPRGHGLGQRSASGVGLPLPPPQPPNWTPPPASDEDQTLPQPAGQSITCARHGRRARPRPPARPAAKHRRRHPTLSPRPSLPQTLKSTPHRAGRMRVPSSLCASRASEQTGGGEASGCQGEFCRVLFSAAGEAASQPLCREAACVPLL